MAKPEFSTKRIQIDKNNARLIVVVAVAAFVVVFCLVATKSLLNQRAYQSSVISKKETALNTLQDNLTAVESLNTAYQEFANAPENILGGNPDGKGDRDGENPRIVLDALPSKYDFPALATSIEKLLKDNGLRLTEITGTDDEVAQAQNANQNSSTAVEIPFTVESEVSPSNGKRLVELFERSIRPMQIRKLEITNQNGQIQITLTGKTFYQPAKTLNVRSEVVK